MSKSDIEAGRAHVALYVKNSAFVKGLQYAQQKATAFGQSLTKIGAGITGMGAAILAPLAGAVAVFTDIGSELDDMSQRTGIGASALAELGFAAKQGGSDLATVERGVKKMQQTIGDAAHGLGSAKEALKDLTLSVEDLAGLSPEDQFTLIAERVAGIKDPTMQAAAAMKIFGKGGTQLLPMLRDLKAARAEAERLGIAPTEEQTKRAAALGDAIDKLRDIISAAVFQIGDALAPAVLAALKVIENIAKPVLEWVRANGALIRTVAAVGVGLVVVGSTITAIGIAFIGAGAAIGGVISMIGFLASAVGMLLSPLGLLTVALVGGITYWALWTEGGRKAVRAIVGAFEPMLQTVKDTIGGVYDALAGGDLALAGNIAMTGLKLVIAQGLASLASLVDGLWGDTLKAIGGDLLSGNFAGAWNTALSAMGAAWDAWSAGVVKTFANVANSIVGMWEAAVNRISTSLLELSVDAESGGGVADFISGSLEGLGISTDMQERALGGLVGDAKGEASQAERLESQRQEQRRRTLPEMIKRVEGELGTARSSGSDDMVQVLEKQLARLNEEYATEYQGPAFDGLAAGRDAIDQQTGSTADAMRSFFDGLAEQADSAAKESAEEFAGNRDAGAGRFDDLLGNLRGDLENLNAEAAAKRAKAAAGMGGEEEAPDDTAAALAGKVAVSFSAAALGAMGQGNGPQERIARATEQMKQKQERLIELSEAMLQEQRNGQLEFTA